MKRKIVKQGGTALTVTLPSKWAADQNLKAGDEVELVQKGNELTIKGQGEIPFESIEINISGLEPKLIQYTMSALHKSGYDEITLLYDDEKAIVAIQEELKSTLLGFIIMDQRPGKTVLRALSKDNTAEFDHALKRSFLVTLSLGDSLYDLLKSKKHDEIGSLLPLEKTNNQLSNFCERLINKSNFMNQKKSAFLFLIVWNIEKIADYYRDIINLVLEQKDYSVSSDSLELLKDINKYLRYYYDLYYKFELQKINYLLTERDKLKEKINKLSINTDNITISLYDKYSKLLSTIFNLITTTICINN